MNYTTLARQFVKGLIKRTEGTEFEPLRLHILSQWIYESDHFRSKLATQFNNAGGMQYRKGYTGPHSKALYTDWQGKENWHFLLESAEQYCDLYLWFISRPRYENRIDTDSGQDFIYSLAAAEYVTDMAKLETDPDKLAKMLKAVKCNPKWSSLVLNLAEANGGLSDDISIPFNYLFRVQSIANRDETNYLLRYEWMDGVDKTMGVEPEIKITEMPEYLRQE